MDKILFVFVFEGRIPKVVSKINRSLFGYFDVSHNGLYSYSRLGLLSNFGVQRVSKGSFIVDELYDKQVFDILSKFNCKIQRYYIKIKKVL